MNGMILGAIAALSIMQQTDTTFSVGSAARLNVETMSGSIRVEVWDQEEIRVQAEHSSRTFVTITRGRRGGIDVQAEARRGPANLVDFRITVPRRLALRLEGVYSDVVVEGSDGAIEAETMRGDISIIGGRGTVKASATMGAITVEEADGRIEVETSTGDIRVSRSSGEIFAESAAGTIVITDVVARVVDVGSTAGRLFYDGTFDRDGTYFFGAHGGAVTIVVPEEASASFNLATVHGSITSNLDGAAESLRAGQRHSFVVGSGGALVEAETFGGRIRVLRKGSEGASAPESRHQPVIRDPLEVALGGEIHLDHVLDLDHAIALELAAEAHRQPHAARVPATIRD